MSTVPQGPQAPRAEAPAIDPTRVDEAMQRLRSQQNLTLGIAAGGLASLLGAGLWALITVTTNLQIGWMAVGVGFLVGYAIRGLGKGVDMSFGIAGSTLALLGCLLGNLLTACGLLASQENVPFLKVVGTLDLTMATNLLSATFSPMDLLFYGIAVYEGYRLSIRKLTMADLAGALPG